VQGNALATLAQADRVAHLDLDLNLDVDFDRNVLSPIAFSRSS
jgi:hypothetical protein